jgi:superfamily I DNA/RNA helicase
LVIEELINGGIAKVPGAKKGRRCNPETIKKRVSEETNIARLWEQVDKKHDLFSVLKDLEAPGKTLLKIRDSLILLIKCYSEFKGECSGEFAKQLSVVTGIWTDPTKLAEDISSVANMLESQQPAGSGSVRLMSMRKAKGLEDDVVIMVGLEDDIVPSPIGDISEEARLFYVGMTRAKENLILCHAFKRPCDISFGQEIMDKPRSRFLDAIGKPSKYLKREA